MVEKKCPLEWWIREKVPYMMHHSFLPAGWAPCCAECALFIFCPCPSNSLSPPLDVRASGLPRASKLLGAPHIHTHLAPKGPLSWPQRASDEARWRHEEIGQNFRILHLFSGECRCSFSNRDKMESISLLKIITKISPHFKQTDFWFTAHWTWKCYYSERNWRLLQPTDNLGYFFLLVNWI